jgi:hypothetical protein
VALEGDPQPPRRGRTSGSGSSWAQTDAEKPPAAALPPVTPPPPGAAGRCGGARLPLGGCCPLPPKSTPARSWATRRARAVRQSSDGASPAAGRGRRFGGISRRGSLHHQGCCACCCRGCCCACRSCGSCCSCCGGGGCACSCGGAARASGGGGGPGAAPCASPRPALTASFAAAGGAEPLSPPGAARGAPRAARPRPPRAAARSSRRGRARRAGAAPRPARAARRRPRARCRARAWGATPGPPGRARGRCGARGAAPLGSGVAGAHGFGLSKAPRRQGASRRARAERSRSRPPAPAGEDQGGEYERGPRHGRVHGLGEGAGARRAAALEAPVRAMPGDAPVRPAPNAEARSPRPPHAAEAERAAIHMGGRGALYTQALWRWGERGGAGRTGAPPRARRPATTARPSLGCRRPARGGSRPPVH